MSIRKPRLSIRNTQLLSGIQKLDEILFREMNPKTKKASSKATLSDYQQIDLRNPSFLSKDGRHQRTVTLSKYEKETRSLSPVKRQLPELQSNTRDSLVPNYGILRNSPTRLSQLGDIEKSQKRIKVYENSYTESSSPKHSLGIYIYNEQLRGFDDKYGFRLIEGYSDKVLNRCIELLQNEDNPVVLENVLPGNYAEEVISNIKSRIGIVPTVNNQSYQIIKSYSPAPNKALVLPTISSPQNHYNKLKQISDYNSYLVSERAKMTPSIQNNESSLVHSNSLSKPRPFYAKITLEAFKRSTNQTLNPEQKSAMLILAGENKSAPMEFGFCEIIFGENRSSCHMFKYYIQRAYRKLKMIKIITTKFIDHLFRKYFFDKITIDFLADSDCIRKEMKEIGFKLQKVDNLNPKYKSYALKKKDFYSLLDAESSN